jgi:hypothetical protein
MKKLTVKFKTDMSANEFAESLTVLNGKANVIVENSSVVVSSDNALVVAFAQNILEDMKERLAYRTAANRFLRAITESISTGKVSEFCCIDGTVQKIDPIHARALANMHDMLSEENQATFLVLACENKSAYEKTVNFARANERGEQ